MSRGKLRSFVDRLVIYGLLATWISIDGLLIDMLTRSDTWSRIRRVAVADILGGCVGFTLIFIGLAIWYEVRAWKNERAAAEGQLPAHEESEDVEPPSYEQCPALSPPSYEEAVNCVVIDVRAM